MLGDYLRLEDNKGWKINLPGPQGFDQSNLSRLDRAFGQKIFSGAGFDPFLKICPRVARGGGGRGVWEDNAWT